MNKQIVPDISTMLSSDVHYGHNKKYSNPLTKKAYGYVEYNHINIIDLNKTHQMLHKAVRYISNIVENGGTILFVSTKKAMSNLVIQYANKCSMPYVNNRWIGGTLTNYGSVTNSIRKMERLQKMEQDGELDSMIKKEASMCKRVINRLEKTIGGISGLKKRPDALFIIDSKKEQNAIKEAKKMGIPIIAVVDTDSSTQYVDYVIPGNDDSKKAVALYLKTVSQVIQVSLQKLYSQNSSFNTSNDNDINQNQGSSDD
jgi:small subunit ribosomal protein S2